jgi:microcystin-dependent protein
MPGVFQFSKTAANNATVVPSINWAEGMAPSAINDSSRAEMAAVACYRDDIAGSIVTTGTSTAYQVTSNQGFDTLAHFDGQVIAFTPHATNGAGPVSMTVDRFANLPLRSSPNTELPSGVLVAGTPYLATYNNTDGALYLQGFYGQQSIPLGASVEFWGTTAPYSNLALMFGQAISRTASPALFAMFNTTYGAGDGTTTFNIRDTRGRVVAGVDNMGGTAANRLTSASGMGTGQLGQAGGVETETLLTANLPPYTPRGTNAASTVNFSFPPSVVPNGSGFAGAAPGTGSENFYSSGQYSVLTATAAAQGFTGTAQGGTSTPVPIVMPAICANRLLRIA